MHEKYRRNLTLSRAVSGDAATFFAEYQAEKLASWFPEQKNAAISILDFGCGDGLMASFMQHIFINATICGLDSDAERIALARDTYDGIKFVCADTTQFLDKTFDLIYATEVFHHLPHAKQADYYAQLLRMLNPGGTLVIFELNPLNLATVYRFKTNPLERNAHLIFPWQLRRLLAQQGTVKIRFYDFFPNILGGMRVLEPYLTWLPFGELYAMSVKKS